MAPGLLHLHKANRVTIRWEEVFLMLLGKLDYTMEGGDIMK